MLELRNQATAQRLSIDRIVTASSSGGTQAGLAVGASLAMIAPPVTGIDIDGKSAELRRQLMAIAADCSRRLDIAAPDESVFELVSDYAAPGYGLPNPGTIEAIRLLATLEGIFLDPVYSGKAMAGLIDMIRKGRFSKDETIVFIHTGGAPALFAYTDKF